MQICTGIKITVLIITFSLQYKSAAHLHTHNTIISLECELKTEEHLHHLLTWLPEGFHKALFTNLFAAPLSILSEAATTTETKPESQHYTHNLTHKRVASLFYLQPNS